MIDGNRMDLIPVMSQLELHKALQRAGKQPFVNTKI